MARVDLAAEILPAHKLWSERCQIVLGDLDAYNGKAKPYAEVRELAERFREYSLRLGFDDAAGIVRSQESYLPALEAMYLLGRYVEQADFRRRRGRQPRLLR